MFTLASVTSLGIIIGMVITDYAVSDDSGLQTLVIGLLQGLAGGTLLYITFYEVLDKEKLAKLGMTGLGGCLLLILGFSLMAGLEAVGKVFPQIVAHIFYSRKRLCVRVIVEQARRKLSKWGSTVRKMLRKQTSF